MPRHMPPAVERELKLVLGWKTRPAPVDLYMAIPDALEASQRPPLPPPVRDHETSERSEDS